MRAHRFRTLIVLLIALAFLCVWLVSVPPLAAQAPIPGVRVIESNAQHLVLDLIPPPHALNPRTLNGTTYLDLTVPDWDDARDAGKPRLPLYAALVAVPQNAQVTLRVLRDNTRTETLSHPLAPAPGLRMDYVSHPDQPTSELVFAPDPAIYQSNQPHPAALAEISAPASWRSQRYLTLRVHPFQYRAASNQLTVHTHVRVEVKFNTPDGARQKALGAPVNEGAFEPVLQTALLNYDAAQAWRAPVRANSSARAQAATASTAYKIAVDADGMYKINCTDLSGAGISLAALALDTVQLKNNGAEIALRVEDADSDNNCDSGDQILFWGTANTSQYTDTNIYWLTYGGAPGKRMNVRPGTGSGTTVTSFTAVRDQHNSNFFITYMPWDENADHWWWYPLPASSDPDSNGDPTSMDITFDLPTVIPSGSASVSVMLGAVSATSHRTQISINGHLVQDQTWTGVTNRTATATFSASFLHTGSNTVRVAEMLPAPNTVWVNHVALTYTSTLTAQDSTLRFQQPANGTWTYALTNFSGSNVQVFDIADPNNVALVNATISGSGPYTAQFTDNATAPREYFALTKGQRKPIVSITADTASDLRSTANRADYLIITHKNFKDSIQPLAALRATQMDVDVIDVQDIYDEFGDGEMNPQAIRDFLAYAYTQWGSPKPSYVLLVGNGNFNFKSFANYSTENNYIPPYLKLVDPWIGLTASDARLVTLDAGSPLPSMAIGRLPALSKSDVDAMVTKIVDYENLPSNTAPAWRTKALFVTDDPDNAGNFYALSDAVADSTYYLTSPMLDDKVYYPTKTASDVTAALNAGRLIVNYVGHSAYTAWAQNLLTGGQATSLTNAGKPFMLLPMTCYDGYFQFPGLTSLSEGMVRAANAAIASWAPTGQGVATHHDVLDRGFFEAVMQQNVRRIGDATIFAKAQLYAGGGGLDLLDTYNLLGDPATHLALPSTLPTPTPSSTPTATRTATFSPTATRTNTATYTPSNTPTKTATPTNTPTFTPTITPGGPTLTPTYTPTNTQSPTPTGTATFTPTVTNSPTPTHTRTLTPSATATIPTPTDPATSTPTATLTLAPTGECIDVPAVPELLAPANKKKLKTRRVPLDWTDALCATYYKVQVRTSNDRGAIAAKKGKLSASKFTTKSLIAGKKYVWRVRACSPASDLMCSAWTGWSLFKVKANAH